MRRGKGLESATANPFALKFYGSSSSSSFSLFILMSFVMGRGREWRRELRRHLHKENAILGYREEERGGAGGNESESLRDPQEKQMSWKNNVVHCI